MTDLKVGDLVSGCELHSQEILATSTSILFRFYYVDEGKIFPTELIQMPRDGADEFLEEFSRAVKEMQKASIEVN